MRRLFAVLAQTVVLVSCGANIPDDATGQDIYETLCVRCHAEDLSGRVGPALGQGSDVATQPDEYLRITITSGLGRMPSFGASLDDEQINRLIEYVRQQQGT